MTVMNQDKEIGTELWRGNLFGYGDLRDGAVSGSYGVGPET